MSKPIKIAPLLIHVDVDSPAKLLEFYQLKEVEFSEMQLEQFYFKAWDRILEFFDRYSLKASFFVVGDELHSNSAIQKVVLKAFQAGHEIENHTWSHPYGLASMPMDEVKAEIIKCNAVIKQITGKDPIGFRSPGCSISSEVINELDNLGMKYDSSGFWSVMNPILKSTHKILFKKGLKNTGFGTATSKLSIHPYFPHPNDWLKADQSARNFMELPLPRTDFLGLPFYNNLNLWAPPAFARTVSKRIDKSVLIYLFHIIEFVDLTDDIPAELLIHPNLKTKTGSKIKFSGEILQNLLLRYQHQRTGDFLKEFGKQGG